MSFSLGDYYFTLDAEGLTFFDAGTTYIIPYTTLAALAFLLIILLSAAALAVSRIRWQRERKND